MWRHTELTALGKSQPSGVRIPAQVGISTHHSTLPGHTEKIYSIRFHPVASDVLVSSSYDMTVRIWELSPGREALCLRGHIDQVRDDTFGDTRGLCLVRQGTWGIQTHTQHPSPQIFSLAWSPDGKKLATVSKDGRLRLYEPRHSPQPLQV